ncbi:hypothetical protein [Rubrivirga sp. IMCC43871]|uniref:hypothetical protein n=1 Tax=Rubrivirga sp. IMCC43871 TaxID=3391575 RepID=UPI0039901393
MTHLSSLARRAGLALVLGLGVAVAADAQPAAQAPALDARLDRLAQGLSLDARQQAALDAVAATYADADRADLWAAAAEVASVLTDEQTAQLQTYARGRRDGARSARGARGVQRGAGRGRARRGTRSDRGDRAERTPLTDAQRTALRTIREETRTQTEALADQYRAGDLSADQLTARVRQLRADAVTRSAALLPAEAATRLRERAAQRDAESDARDAALGLTAAQRQAMVAQRTARQGPDLRPYLDDQGRLDRRALRDAQREQRTEREPVLSDEQRAVVLIHAAIAGRGGRQGRHDGRRR